MTSSGTGWRVGSRPAATRVDHRRFCQREGWTQVRDARGRTGTHHETYELVLIDGSILRTRVSHPVNRTTYGRSLFAHILRDQLQVSAEEFWDCVRDGILPTRSQHVPPTAGIPLRVVHQLMTRGGLSEDEIRGMSREEAMERLTGLGDS